MKLMATLERSWRMFKCSLKVINRNPKLLVFPVVTGTFTVLIALFFLAPLALIPTEHSIFQAQHWVELGQKLFRPDGAVRAGNSVNYVPTGWLSGYGVVVYLVSMFAATFSNVAFGSQALAALNGEKVSVRGGFLAAGQRVKSILVWSLFAGLIGLLIKKVEERLGFVGRLIVGLIGVAWSVASVFAIPVIIREQPTANPLSILTKSAGTIKRTWGEMLTGFVGLGSANLLAVLGSLVFLGLALAASVALHNFWIMLPAGVLWLVAILAYSYFANVASQVYLCATYIYASEGVVPEGYDRELMDCAWKVKKS
jgi:hypothetical protein